MYLVIIGSHLFTLFIPLPHRFIHQKKSFGIGLDLLAIFRISVQTDQLISLCLLVPI